MVCYTYEWMNAHVTLGVQVSREFVWRKCITLYIPSSLYELNTHGGLHTERVKESK